MFLPRPTVSKSAKTEAKEVQASVTAADESSYTPSPARISVPKTTSSVAPEFHFNIQIQLPENASEAVYEAIFRNIGRYLLGNNQE